ncbi:hypothetical protein F5Y15DRAFT_369758 [Xylariaceae sp. FL0016]|nr:hypothetical protein F5Y15DRAFT_369758 [Xylariaceae sp. FL0016]
MGSWTAFLLTYLLGGVTFVPLVVITVLLHAHFTFPTRDDAEPVRKNDPDSIVQPGDDTSALEAAQKEESRQRLIAESDVAAGYFAVCREYTPMGINAKPIERSTPVGSATVAAPSPSVYQSMYRSIFDRKQASGPLDDGKSVSQRPKKAGNVFYVVLRHGHLMLFDDDEQLEVRHVISLAHHDVSIYSGGDKTPEGELYIKRNAICLTRRVEGKELTPDTLISKPFYLFSENCSAKEDFYFSLLRNQEQSFAAQGIAPGPIRFDVKNIISLVQRLHASEDHMPTRWLNAFIGRIFLGLHKTKDIENTIREKITKKISRVNRPSFLTRITIQKIETGDSPPYFMNPRLKDLNVEGECLMEADVKYTGNFRLEVAATARIDLGSRFKAREVNLILAVVLRKLEGHVFFKIKPPPSNRIWFSFQSMPKIEMTIEPIVSSRQITYTVILRQIESRIKEVIAETLVTPFWDDLPFFNTEHKKWRGGVFEGDDAVEHSPDHEAIAAQLGQVDEVSQMEQATPPSPGTPELPSMEKSHSLPVLEEGSQASGFWSRKLTAKRGANVLSTSSNSASTTAIDDKNSSPSTPDVPRSIRSGSFSTSSPVVGTDPAHAEAFRASSTTPDRENAHSAIANISAKSQNNSPAQTPIGSPSKTLDQVPGVSSSSSSEILPETEENERTPTGQGRRHTASSTDSTLSDTAPSDSPAPSSRNSIKSGTGSIGRNFFARKDSPSLAQNNGTPEGKRVNTLAAVSSAAATAKRWGLNAIQRQAERNANGRKLSDPTVDLSQPMGRGQPLPPPGTPLPKPGEKTTPMSAPKRKTMPPPNIQRQSISNANNNTPDRRQVPPPPLPRRRRVSEIHATADSHEGTEENLFVVEAPADSEPNSPLPDNAPSYTQPWVEDAEEVNENERSNPLTSSEPPVAPALPPRRSSSGHQSTEEARPAEHADEEDYSSWIDNPEFQDEGTKIER